MRRRLWWLLVLLPVVGVGIGAGFLLFRQPLRVSWWTRRQQNGYVLEQVSYEKPSFAIHRGLSTFSYSPDYEQVFQRAHVQVVLRVPKDIVPPSPPRRSVSAPLQVTAIASDGQELPCAWTLNQETAPSPAYSLQGLWLRLVAWMRGAPIPASLLNPTSLVYRLRVAVPCGYPSSVKWLELRLRDGKGRTARYRIHGLPPSQRRIQPPVQVVAQHQVEGATLSAQMVPIPPGRADITRDHLIFHQAGGRENLLLRFRLDGLLPETSSREWELHLLDCYPEWDSPHPQPLARFVQPVSPSAYGRQPSFSIACAVWQPYPALSRYYGVRAQLREYAYQDEQVTFTNIPVRRSRSRWHAVVTKEQRQRTSSGIEVVLPKQDEPPPIEFGGCASITLLVRPSGREVQLPGSVLFRRYQKSLEVRLVLGGIVQGTGETPQRQEKVVHVPEKHLQGEKIPQLTVTVRQRVRLRTFPLKFVVPMEQQ